MVPPVEADKRPLELTPPPSFFQTRIDLFEKRKAERKAWVDQQPREDIKIELLDGKVKDGTSWETSPADIAKAISKALYKKTVIARVDGELWDLDRPLEKSCRLELLDFNDPEGKKVFWHSSAHILGEAAERRWGCSLCIGPPVDNGFYYEMALPDGGAVTQADYEPLKQIAQKAINEKQPFERLELSKEDLLSMFSYNKYKQHIINDKIPDGTSTTVYRCGPLIDLCRGPHVPHTGHITVLEVMKNSSSYFLGDSKNDSLQRLYGVSFPEKDMMKKHKHMLEEAAKRDHRKVGQDQELFFFDQLSPGSAFFQKHGVVIYNALQSFVREEYWKRNYEEVISPNMYNSALWKQSGHWQHYKDDMFTFDVEKEQWALKPMNCPGHCVIYGHRERSYRELPIRMAEFGILHRNEASGALSGLTRVRRFVQDDSHIFCTEAQIEQEIKGLFDFIKTIYGTFGLSFKMKLSTMPEDHLGDEATWQRAEAQLTKALEEFEAETGTKWELNPGDGAFYGPKIDVTISDALNREFQSATIQLDFQLPQQFNLEYRTEEQAGGEGKKSEEKRADRKGDEKAEKKADQNTEKKVDERAERKTKDVASYRRELTPGCARPVMIHRALYGSFERFIGILTEHFGGKWPFWLSPRQVLIVPVMLGAYDYCVEVQRRLRKERIHADVDLSGNTMSRKVRTGQLQQYNFIFVVGAKEMETNSVNVRNRDLPGTQKEGLPVPVEEIVSVLKNLRDERVLKNNYGEQSVGK
ncbi:threonyl-tRNA synthetase-like protein [Piedraia hortae CBS 480.64]|uniref:threonine--tRNA ligase n=1 Tax=Piedraia hortae CBS 480.64 TaxID=1314780 RepID=A0A6A7C416_9PEZI|nr:threonyl-tRNA synthetase-like protein [Piedraia hortae CBS 480.64]